MTLRGRDLQEIPADTAAIGQQLLGAADRYRVIGDRLAALVEDAEFAGLYAPHGRNALSPGLLAMVTLFQFLEDLPDRDAARAVVVRLDWKYALHLELGYGGFHYSDLCLFRQRLLAHGEERLVFDLLLAKIRALGFIKKRGKQRTDSIAVLGAVTQLSVLELAWESLRLAVRGLGEADPDWSARVLPASFREDYGQRRPDYRLSAAERAAALQAAGSDGYWLLAQVAREDAVALGGLPAVVTLRAVWEQRFVQASGQVQVREDVVPAPERILTPHDPGVRAGQKRGKGWDGEKAHVTETAEADQPNFITDVSTGNASGGDAAELPAVRTHLVAVDLLPAEQVVDSGYISGQQLAQSQAAGIDLVGPPLGDTSANGFKLADFVIDRVAQQATCPQGQVSVKWAERTERDGSRAVHIQFAAKTCAACPLRAQCTTAKDGRSLSLSEHYELLQARRAESQTPAYKQRLRARPAIEATLSELVRSHGFRRHRYRGDDKRDAENLLKAAACNLKRLARALLTHPPLPAAAPACALAGSR